MSMSFGLFEEIYQKNMQNSGAVKKEQSPKKEKERPRVYNELKVFLSVIINL